MYKTYKKGKEILMDDKFDPLFVNIANFSLIAVPLTIIILVVYFARKRAKQYGHNQRDLKH